LFFRAQNGGDRPIWVQAYLGGQLRLCDPNKSGTPAPPDACCTSVCCGISGLTSTNHCKD
jgi:hypothetical protein